MIGQEQNLCKPRLSGVSQVYRPRLSCTFRFVRVSTTGLYVGVATCIHTRLHQHGWPPHCPRLACQDGRVLLGFPVLGESALRSRVQRWPCVLELGHRLSLVAVVRSADQRLATQVYRNKCSCQKKTPGITDRGQKLLARLKARLARVGVPQPGRFTKESEEPGFPHPHAITHDLGMQTYQNCIWQYCQITHR